jgi:class 3 adenylate cyclase
MSAALVYTAGLSTPFSRYSISNWPVWHQRRKFSMADSIGDPTVTWLFTDIECSTRLWQSHPHAMPAAYVRHDAILREAISTNTGTIHAIVGDALQSVFPTVTAAARAALGAQRALDAEPWPLPTPLRVRMAIHGEPLGRGDGRYRAEQLLALGHGGQILLSEHVAGFFRRASLGSEVLFLGDHLLPGETAPVPIHQLTDTGLCSDFPPLRSRSNHPTNLPSSIQLPNHLLQAADTLSQMILEDGARLITILGDSLPDAILLSQGVGRHLLPHFAGGVHLLPTPHPDLDTAIGTLLGARSPTTIGHANLLLLIPPTMLSTQADVLAELLACCPNLRIIVIANAPLNSRWERVLSLPLP